MILREQRRFDHLYELMLRNLVPQGSEMRYLPRLPMAFPIGLERVEKRRDISITLRLSAGLPGLV